MLYIGSGFFGLCINGIVIEVKLMVFIDYHIIDYYVVNVVWVYIESDMFGDIVC